MKHVNFLWVYHRRVAALLPSSSLSSFPGERGRPAGCGWCHLCFDWLEAQACVISCGTCSSPAPDSDWHTDLAPPTLDYITAGEECHVCLLSSSSVSSQVVLLRWWFFTLTLTSYTRQLLQLSSGQRLLGSQTGGVISVHKGSLRGHACRHRQ